MIRWRLTQRLISGFILVAMLILLVGFLGWYGGVSKTTQGLLISMMDRSGSLTLERVLGKIHRHTPQAEKTIPKGITDLSGRGLFMISRQSRLIINILKSVRTEVIFLRYNGPTLNTYQSLIINEKNPAD